MKILVVAASRTGGTMFSRWIAMEFGIKHISEPMAGWRENRKLFDVWKDKNICVKINPWECDSDFQKHFDKTILLVRREIKEQAISLLRAEETNTWHSLYFIDENWISQRESKIKEYEDIVDRYNKLTMSWKTENNIIVDYEDVYFNFDKVKSTISNYIEPEIEFKHLWMLNKKNKYRNQNELKKDII